MITWVLLLFIWTGSVMEGTPLRSYATLQECLAEKDHTELMGKDGQLVCWPDEAPLKHQAPDGQEQREHTHLSSERSL